MGKYFLFFSLILAACASIGSSLQCYACTAIMEESSINNTICEDPFKETNVQTKTCGSEEVCLKQIILASSYNGGDVPTMTFRECAPKSICRKEPTELKEHCHICSEDLCNSVVKVVPSLSTFIVLYNIIIYCFL